MLDIEQIYTAQSLKSNRTSSLHIITELEDSIKAYLGDDDKEVILLSSKTEALHYALRACNVKPAFEVCVPSFASEEIVKEVLKINAIPVFVGSESETWNMDADLLEDAIDDRIALAHIKPQAVVLNAAYGMPAAMHRFNEICFRRRIPLIEYSEEALGSEFYGRKLGTYGWHWYGIISFTSGGAALICKGRENKERLMKLISRRRSAFMTPKYAIAVLEEMQKIDERIAHQRKIQSLYEKLLKDVDGITVHSQPVYNLSSDEPPFYDSNYQCCTMLLDDKLHIQAVELCKALSSVGVDVQQLYKPLHSYSEYSQYPSCTNGVCEDIYRRGLCLPSRFDVTDDVIRDIVTQIEELMQ